MQFVNGSIIPFQTDVEIRNAIPVAVKHFKAHGVLAYPTETIYGFGTVIDEQSVQTLISLKGREEGKPFLLLISNLGMLTLLGVELTQPARILAEKFWPGPLTLILPTSNRQLPVAIRGPNEGIAVRWTSHAGITKLLNALGEPITSTSVNTAGEAPANSPVKILNAWNDETSKGVLKILDGGALNQSVPSTIVDCTGSAPRLVRAGAVPVEELQSAVSDLC